MAALYRSIRLCLAGLALILALPQAAFAAHATSILNQASVNYFDNAYQENRDARSNAVRATSAPAIRYYRSATFQTLAATTHIGSALFVETSAPACDMSSAADALEIILVSRKTGDEESFMATETAANSGVFRIDSTVMTRSMDAGPAVHGDHMLSVMKNDTLDAMIKGCGAAVTTTSILIDPAGVVYDSRSNAPVAGAVVTLIDITGAGNGGRPGAPAVVFDMDGTTPAPSTVTTGTDGSYQFPLVAPSSYRLQIAPPTDYAFPSRVAPGSQPQGRQLHFFGSFGGAFPVNESTGAVTIDIPLDVDTSGLFIDKTASRTSAEIASFIDYNVTVKNRSTVALTGITVNDTLPAGFSFVPGTARLNGVAANDPVGSRGPQLAFPVGDLGVNASAVLTYRVLVGPGAMLGDGTNRAQAVSAAPEVRTSRVATVQVKVQAGVFTSKAYLIGKVYADCDGSGMQEAGEPGVPGVRVYLEDGSYAVTDIDGKYSFFNVAPRTRVLKADTTTLPAGATLAVLANRNGGDAGSRFVDLQKGELHQADFALSACTPGLQAEIARRRAALEPREKAAPAAVTAGAATAPSAPAANASAQPAVAPAEPDLHALDNTLGFVGLEDGMVLKSAQIPVRIKGVIGARFAFSVNGKPVGDDRVGKRSSLVERQIDVLEYIGVNLEPGTNRLEVRQFDGFGNPRGSKAITLVAPGRLARIHLGAHGNLPADGRATARIRISLSDAAGVPVTTRMPVTLEAARGTWQVADLDPREPGVQTFIADGAAEFELLAPSEPGEAVVRVSSGTVKEELRFNFVPELRPLIAAGIIEGTLRLSDLKRGALAPATARDGFEESLQHFSRTLGNGDAEAAARSAFFLKGKIKGDALLTMAYDSDKEDQEKLFKDIDPNAYYPVYGDASAKGFDAQSTSKLYVRIDKNKSWLLYGDLNTPAATPARSLGMVSRSMTGLRQHYENERVSVDAFASRSRARQLSQEIPANGTSGPFLLRTNTMIANSERIEIITRDRNQPALIIKTVGQARLVDYEIEPLTGRILFRAPIPSLDSELNPISIRIIYEVDQGGEKFWTTGVAAQVRVTEQIEIGGTLVDDRNPQDPMRLESVNASVRLAEKTGVVAELAQMEKATTGKGQAGRAEFNHVSGDLEVRVHGGRADVAFDNPASNLSKGRAEAGARALYRVGERTRLVGEFLHSEDVATGSERDGVQAGVIHELENGVRIETGVRQAHESAGQGVVLANPDTTSVRLKVSAQVPGLPQAGVSVEAEQDVRNSDRRMVAVGGDYQFANGGRLYGRHELVSSLGSLFALNDSQQRNATVIGIDTDYMQNGRVFSEYRARSELGGPVAEAAIGLRNLWNVDEGVRLNTSFERVHVFNGAAANESIALAGGIEYAKNPRWKGTARLELRHGAQSDGLLNTLGLAYKLDDAWTMLGKSTLALTRNKQLGGERRDALLQLGAAYRALASTGWNGLGKYEYKLEQDTGLLGLKRDAHIVSVHANNQIARGTMLSARYAAKLAFDRSGGIASKASAQLIGARVTQDIGKRWDIGVSANMLVGGHAGRQYGLGGEVGYMAKENLWVSAGYNAFGFKDRDLSAGNYTDKGFYVRLRFKFDEKGLQSLIGSQGV